MTRDRWQITEATTDARFRNLIIPESFRGDIYADGWTSLLGYVIGNGSKTLETLINEGLHTDLNAAQKTKLDNAPNNLNSELAAIRAGGLDNGSIVLSKLSPGLQSDIASGGAGGVGSIEATDSLNLNTVPSGTMIYYDDASDITITLPDDEPAGKLLYFEVTGTGKVNIDYGSNVTWIGGADIPNVIERVDAQKPGIAYIRLVSNDGAGNTEISLDGDSFTYVAPAPDEVVIMMNGGSVPAPVPANVNSAESINISGYSTPQSLVSYNDGSSSTLTFAITNPRRGTRGDDFDFVESDAYEIPPQASISGIPDDALMVGWQNYHGEPLTFEIAGVPAGSSWTVVVYCLYRGGSSNAYGTDIDIIHGGTTQNGLVDAKSATDGETFTGITPDNGKFEIDIGRWSGYNTGIVNAIKLIRE